MTGKAIITLQRADGSIVGEPEVRDAQPADFPAIAAEFEAKVADLSDDVATFSLVGA